MNAGYVQLVLEQPLHCCDHGLRIIGLQVEVHPDLGDAVVGFAGAATGAHTVGQWAENGVALDIFESSLGSRRGRSAPDRHGC